MLALIAMIPGIGAPLAAALGVFGGFLKPAATAAGGLIQSAVKNPYVVGALVAAGAFLFWNHEEGRVTAAKLQGQKDVAAYQQAFTQERASFATVNQALKAQNSAVQALSTAGQSKLKASAQIAASAAPAAAQAQRQANAILASGNGSDVCARALDTDNAFLEQIR